MQSTKDSIVPNNKWEFDEEVTSVFDDMLERSIPQYEVMRKSVSTVASYFVPPKGALLDLGCSSGGALKAMYDIRPDIEYYGVEVSQSMKERAEKECPFAEILGFDICTELSQCDLRCDVALSVLTLQFTPIEYRQSILANIASRASVFVLVEKVIGNTAPIDDMMVELYYRMKGENGYTQEQIAAKRKSLQGVLVPVTDNWNRELLKGAGFSQVDCFWRWMNFAAWIAIK